VWYSSHVLVEREDAESFVVGTDVTFINWGNLTITTVHKSEDGKVCSAGALSLLSQDLRKYCFL